jgi:hypothetical protein
MTFTALRKDDDGNIIEYDLKLYNHQIACLYKDRSGVYISTYSGKLYKVKSSLEELENELNF